MIPQQDDPASLANLHDVVETPEVSLWPTAPGWILLGVAVLVLLAVLVVHLVLRHRALRYRREALAELQRIRSSQQPEELPALLKRVALRAHPRAVVAALSGATWTQFLDRTGGGGRFARGPGEMLAVLAYGASGAGEVDALFDAAEAWIRAQGPAR